MKFKCECGNIIRDQGYSDPSRDKFAIVADQDFEKWPYPDTDLFLAISSQVLRCTNCKRLWIWWEGKSKMWEEYLPIGHKDNLVMGTAFENGASIEILCECNHAIRYLRYPDPNGFTLIADEDYEKLSPPFDANKFRSVSSRGCNCATCKRFWIFWKGINNRIEGFSHVSVSTANSSD